MRIELEKIQNKIVPKDEYICMFIPNGKWHRVIYYGMVNSNSQLIMYGYLQLELDNTVAVRLNKKKSRTEFNCICLCENHFKKMEYRDTYVWFRVTEATINTFNKARTITDVEKVFSLIEESTGVRV